jgi:PKD repeat protein
VKRRETRLRWVRGAAVAALLVPLLLWLGGCWPFNTAPVAAFTVRATIIDFGESLAFSAILSSDEDGIITKFEWDFGDGGSATGESVTHTYTAIGSYTVVLRVTDDDDATSTAQKVITVNPVDDGDGGGGGPGPTATFTATPLTGPSPLTVTFNASASAYAGHAITAYFWDFGDGTTGAGMTTVHTYGPTATMSYNVVLRIIAADNTEDTATKTITVTVVGPTPPTSAPTASFTTAPNKVLAPKQIEFNPENSSAAAGRTLQHYLWTFGDGTAPLSENSDAHVFHRYVTENASETFTPSLTVVDNEGATDSESRTVTVENYQPTAGFEIYDKLGTPLPVGGTWKTDDVDFADVQTGARTVWIRSLKVLDSWIGTTGADPLPQGTASSNAPNYSNNNFCFDPEGQGWDDNDGGTYVAADDVPAGWPNPAWGIQTIKVVWGDGTTMWYDYYTDVMNGTGQFSHAYTFAGGYQEYTIKVTAIDFLGAEASFSREITMTSP